MSLLVFFTTRVIFKTAFSLVQEVGDDKTSAITADVENYLENAKSVLWVAADTVDHMVEEGATEEEIQNLPRAHRKATAHPRQTEPIYRNSVK